MLSDAHLVAFFREHPKFVSTSTCTYGDIVNADTISHRRHIVIRRQVSCSFVTFVFCYLATRRQKKGFKNKDDDWRVPHGSKEDLRLSIEAETCRHTYKLKITKLFMNSEDT